MRCDNQLLLPARGPVRSVTHHDRLVGNCLPHKALILHVVAYLQGISIGRHEGGRRSPRAFEERTYQGMLRSGCRESAEPQGGDRGVSGCVCVRARVCWEPRNGCLVPGGLTMTPIRPQGVEKVQGEVPAADMDDTGARFRYVVTRPPSGPTTTAVV